MDVLLILSLILFVTSKPVFSWNWIITNAHNLNAAIDDVGTDEFSRDDHFFADHPRHLNQLPRKEKGNARGKLVAATASQECAIKEDCSTGHFCDRHFGTCQRLRQAGDICRSDTHCTDGFDCMFGRCLPRVPPGKKGARCSDKQPCGPGHCCVREKGEHVCKANLASGDHCYVPEGGLAYNLHQLCPCDVGLRCGRTSTLKPNRWMSPWVYQRSFRCIPN